eukprot:m.13959 g.13959  ORF g.13959 m.13959 type:complete len:320 (-) comp7008_c1_seq1:183-1142(-)
MAEEQVVEQQQRLGLGAAARSQGLARYQRIDRVGQGAYGVVYKALDRETNQLVALKRIRLQSEDEGVPCTAIREISLLKELHHPNIVRLYDVLHSERKLTLVFEFCDQDLEKYLETRRGQPPELQTVKSFLYQLLNGVAFCHDHRILHRDLKPQNLLINKRNALKLADFGLARAFGIPVRQYSHEVVTLWYRAPDVLLGSTGYDTSIDIWSSGCIFGEMMTGTALFRGDSVPEQYRSITEILGTPTPETWPDIDKLPLYTPPTEILPGRGLASLPLRMDALGMDLLESMLRYVPESRISAERAMHHEFFSQLPQAMRQP